MAPPRIDSLTSASLRAPRPAPSASPASPGANRHGAQGAPRRPVLSPRTARQLCVPLPSLRSRPQRRSGPRWLPHNEPSNPGVRRACPPGPGCPAALPLGPSEPLSRRHPPSHSRRFARCRFSDLTTKTSKQCPLRRPLCPLQLRLLRSPPPPSPEARPARSLHPVGPRSPRALPQPPPHAALAPSPPPLLH